MDSITTIDEAKAKISSFCTARDWDQYHNPKDLAIGIVTEGAELLDLFRFRSEEESIAILANVQKRDCVGDELADILYFLLRFSERFGFDLSDELDRKLRKNNANYPVAKAKGSNLKHGEL
jgi:NTP pyrophosphatase (non-canonical NTP hydrolase)